MEKQTPKPSFAGFAIVAALISTVLIIGLFLYWQNNQMTELKSEIAEQQKALETKVEKIENGEASAEAQPIVEENTSPTANWKKMSVFGFSMLYPKDWTVQEEEAPKDHEIYSFYDADDQKVGWLYCPVPETGFEGMLYDTQKRLYRKDGELYQAELWEGRPDVTDYPAYVSEIPKKEMIIFTKKPTEGDEYLAGGDSCMMIIRNIEDMVPIATEIYNSFE
ncbi:MAG: hypothetical protein ACOZBH_04180 [Patescibacteria group bacterium]